MNKSQLAEELARTEGMTIKEAELVVNTFFGTLEEALNELACNDVLRRAMGDHIYTAYDRAKRTEWDDYRIHVTEWEIDRYLHTL